MTLSSLVLREETDDWAILYDPDSGQSFGLNPVSVLIWKNLDGRNTIEKIVRIVKHRCYNVDKNIEKHILEFIKELLENGLIKEAVRSD